MTERYSGVGTLVKCKSSNNGEPLFPWERWFKKREDFKFNKNVLYTAIFDKGKVFVVDRNYEPLEFDTNYFNYLFTIVSGR